MATMQQQQHSIVDPTIATSAAEALAKTVYNVTAQIISSASNSNNNEQHIIHDNNNMHQDASILATAAASKAASDLISDTIAATATINSDTADMLINATISSASSPAAIAAAAAAAGGATYGEWAQYLYYDFWEMNHNPELNKYSLFDGGPWQLLTIVGLYLYFVLNLGPKLMSNREPFDLKPLIRFYNFGMVVFNAYLFCGASPFLNYGSWCWGCGKALQPMVDEAIPIVWLVLLSRFCDFFDTVFFVLRKKFSHVSFLHVFHHTVVPVGFWIGIKFAFYPVCCFIPYLNLVVHVIMYSYYGLSTFGPKVQKYLWWKVYLTRLQIAQFLIAVVHSLQPLFLYGYDNCTYPAIFVLGQTLGALLFLWLFVSFYIKAYMRDTATAPIADKTSTTATLIKADQLNGHKTFVASSTTTNNQTKLKAQ